MSEKTPGFTRKVAQQILETEGSTIPQHLYDHAKVAFMDWISVSVIAANEPLVIKLIEYAKAMGGAPQASLVGHDKKVNVSQAALINGAMGHALDFDDTLPQFLGHPTVALLPGLVALAQWQNLPGRDLLTAFLTGLYIGSWIGMSAGVPHYELGWHGTSTIGRQGAAAACAKLLGLTEQQTVYALGIAGTQAGGVKQVFGSMCKPFHAGAAAQGGVMAALLAENGFTSAEDIYEGPLGFFKTFKGDPDAVKADFMGDAHPVEMLAQKYHAACHCTHGPIDIVLDLAEERDLKAEDIADMQVYCSQISLDNANKTEPKTGLDGKFSFTYSIANALIRKNTGLVAYSDEMVNDGRLQDLMKRITVQVDDDHRDAGLRTTAIITRKDGEVITRTSDPLARIPDLRGKQEKIAAKFMNLCGPVLGDEKTKQLKKQIDDLDNLEDFGLLLSLTRL